MAMSVYMSEEVHGMTVCLWDRQTHIDKGRGRYSQESTTSNIA